ncbi:putative transcription factor bHLH family [Helianthus debilis subsp. tardiflorus]
MDNRSMAWLPELEMEEPSHILKHQQAHPHYSNSMDSFSSESFKGYPNMVTVNQSVQLTTLNGDVHKQQDYKAAKTSSFAPNHASSSNTFTISFGNHTSPQEINQLQLCGKSNLKHPDTVLMPKEETSLNEFLGSFDIATKFRNTRRNHRQAQEHVLAERKRREKLAERFISLSALLPGLKKMDKATVLEDACNYIIQLQTRVKELEHTNVKGKDIIQESAVILAGKSKFCGSHEDFASSSDDANYLTSSSTCNPEIKARISGSKILVRIYCMKSSSLVLKTISEMESLNITITCFNVVPFNTAHLIAITAQMNDDVVITAKYLVECLQSALRDFH